MSALLWSRRSGKLAPGVSTSVLFRIGVVWMVHAVFVGPGRIREGCPGFLYGVVARGKEEPQDLCALVNGCCEMGIWPRVVQLGPIGPRVGTLNPDQFLHIGRSGQVLRMIIQPKARPCVEVLRIDCGHSIAIPVVLRVLGHRRQRQIPHGGDVHVVQSTGLPVSSARKDLSLFLQ